MIFGSKQFFQNKQTRRPIICVVTPLLPNNLHMVTSKKKKAVKQQAMQIQNNSFPQLNKIWQIVTMKCLKQLPMQNKKGQTFSPHSKLEF